MLNISGGHIEVDGVDISTISKEALRAKVIALPQDPWFIPGTVRDNLTVRMTTKEDNSDTRLLSVLEDVRLREKFEELRERKGTSKDILDMELVPSEMLTSGETQLFAIARATLTEGKILIMDEATSRFVEG
jgi:ABC-type multidrug transport system fused ATPase/permease subunit